MVHYEDDPMIIDRVPFLEPLTGVMQDTLKLVGEWCGWTRNYKWIRKCLLKMGKNLRKRIAYLGVILHRILSWKEHQE